MYTFSVNIEIEDVDSLEEAYIKLNKIMHQEIPAHQVSWESTDECFDEDGNEIDAETLQDARMKGFARINTDDYDFPHETNDRGMWCKECGNNIDYGPSRNQHDSKCRFFRHS